MSAPTFLTVFADASVGHRPPHHAGFGGWAVLDGASTLIGGRLPDHPDVSVAEARALCRTVDHALGTLIGRADILMLQSDSTTALSWFCAMLRARVALSSDRPIGRSLPTNVPRIVRDEVGVLRGWLPPEMPIYVKHVKGHQNPGASGRAWVNFACDRIASAARRGVLDPAQLGSVEVRNALRRRVDPWPKS